MAHAMRIVGTTGSGIPPEAFRCMHLEGQLDGDSSAEDLSPETDRLIEEISRGVGYVPSLDLAEKIATVSPNSPDGKHLRRLACVL